VLENYVIIFAATSCYSLVVSKISNNGVETIAVMYVTIRVILSEIKVLL